jgi:hypothetical protein
MDKVMAMIENIPLIGLDYALKNKKALLSDSKAFL